MALLEDLAPALPASGEQRGLLEGPRIQGDGSVLFSDVLAGGVHRLARGGEVELVVARRRGIGGLVAHRDGGIVTTGRTLLHRTADGADRVLLERDDVAGFNDLTTTPGGAILVGALRYRPMAGEPQADGLLLCVGAPADAAVVSSTIVWPNGIAVDADGEHAYVADFAREHVKRVALDGSGEEVHCVAPRGSCDGLALDAQGCLWVALGHGSGIARFAPDGALDGVVDLPAEFVSSIAFGGADGRDVAITAIGALYRGRASVAGAPVADAAI
jgi:sugar lactone lactonase YvrE